MDEPEVIEAVFHCDECQSIAATVYCVPSGVDHPLAELSSTAHDRLVLDGFMSRLTEMLPRGSKALRSALQDADPLALWQLNPLWAPFYCPTCRLSYCWKHWKAQVFFADDFPGWYEHTTGECPNGHTRLLDD